MLEFSGGYGCGAGKPWWLGSQCWLRVITPKVSETKRWVEQAYQPGTGNIFEYVQMQSKLGFQRWVKAHRAYYTQFGDPYLGCGREAARPGEAVEALVAHAGRGELVIDQHLQWVLECRHVVEPDPVPGDVAPATRGKSKFTVSFYR